ncbi:MAG: arsinothricin resistance N-acetyltransferase ArsN1 family A [Acidiferrobacterales bacterium]
MKARLATIDDTDAIARIYNQGIEDRVATFETQLRTADDMAQWFSGEYAVVVVENDGAVVAFAATFPYRSRECYSGVREFSVYVDRDQRGRGAGRLAMEALITTSRKRGHWKLLSRVFPENTQSLKLLYSIGFREVGFYKKHGQLDGEWRDVVIVEYLIDS